MKDNTSKFDSPADVLIILTNNLIPPCEHRYIDIDKDKVKNWYYNKFITDVQDVEDSIRESLGNPLRELTREEFVNWLKTSDDTSWMRVACELHGYVNLSDCITCMKLDDEINKRFTDEQLSFKGMFIDNQETLPNGVCITQARLFSEVCPYGYMCDDCESRMVELYPYAYCAKHSLWIAQ